MDSIALMIGGGGGGGVAALNEAALIGGNYLVPYLSGDDKAAQEEKVRHDKFLDLSGCLCQMHTQPHQTS